MPLEQRPAVAGYVVALAATATAVLLRAALDPLLGERAFTPLLYAAVAISVWFGGTGPALVSAIAGYVAVDQLILARDGGPFPADPPGWAALFIYLLSCAIFIAFGAVMQRSRRGLEVKQRELERESAERAHVERALRVSERGEQQRRLELEAYVESAPAAIWIAHDAQCTRITGNPAVSALLGVPRGVNLSRTGAPDESAARFDIYRGGELPDPMDLPMQTAGRTGRAVLDQELEFRFRDGRPSKFAYGNAVPLRDDEGRVTGVIATFVDITERRRIEELRRESEGRFRTLADQAPVLIWINDLEGCEYVNREYLRFLGRTLDEVRGMGWVDAVHPEDREEYLEAYRRAVERRERFEAQLRFRAGSGEYRWMMSTGLPRLTADGALIGYLGCSSDITEVRQAMEALQESDRRKDEFLATLAHELRNPLAPLRNGLEILRLVLGGVEEVEETLQVMERQLAHMVRMVDDLVDVSRISRGKLDLRRERIDLGDVVRDAAHIARRRIEEEGHLLVPSLPDEPAWVEGDATRLAQVIANLLDNAAKYTRPPGRIDLTLARVEGEALISVADTGIGIAREMLSKVFDMFTQADRPLERSQGGLGIGLTLVKRLVELHGGTVSAESEGPGRGSRFTVRVPLAAPAPAADQATTRFSAAAGAPRQGESAPHPAPGPRRVLVVDDNHDAASSLAAMLEILGHEARTASDGIEALEVMERFRPDLVLLDIGMPRMNGYEVCRRIRAKPWGADVVVAAVTGWGQDADKQRAREAGFDQHLTKPMDPAALGMLLAASAAAHDASG
jgi:PAS domain S-box-containing protein